MIDPRRLSRAVQRGILALSAAGLLYLVARFESVRLPEDACSPIRTLAPGSLAIFDTWTGGVGVGDVVLFADATGERALLGRVAAPPPEVDARGGHWVVGEVASCPTLDSRDLGPIPAARLRGRLVLAVGGL